MNDPRQRAAAGLEPTKQRLHLNGVRNIQLLHVNAGSGLLQGRDALLLLLVRRTARHQGEMPGPEPLQCFSSRQAKGP